MPAYILAISKSILGLVLLVTLSVTWMERHMNLSGALRYYYDQLEYQYVDLRIQLQEVRRELGNVSHAIDSLDSNPSSTSHSAWDASQPMAQTATSWQRLLYRTESLLLQSACAVSLLPYLQEAILLWDNEKLACE